MIVPFGVVVVGRVTDAVLLLLLLLLLSGWSCLAPPGPPPAKNPNRPKKISTTAKVTMPLAIPVIFFPAGSLSVV